MITILQFLYWGLARPDKSVRSGSLSSGIMIHFCIDPVLRNLKGIMAEAYRGKRGYITVSWVSDTNLQFAVVQMKQLRSNDFAIKDAPFSVKVSLPKFEALPSSVAARLPLFRRWTCILESLWK